MQEENAREKEMDLESNELVSFWFGSVWVLMLRWFGARFAGKCIPLQASHVTKNSDRKSDVCWRVAFPAISKMCHLNKHQACVHCRPPSQQNQSQSKWTNQIIIDPFIVHHQ